METQAVLTHIVYPLIVSTWALLLGLHIKLLTYLIRTVVAIEQSINHHDNRLTTLERKPEK